MYNFKRLIKKYSKIPPQVKKATQGRRDYTKGGIWVEEGQFEPFEGAVIPLGEKLLLSDRGYTTDDKKLYTYDERIENNMLVKHKGLTYTTMEYKGFEEFDIGLKIFILKAGGVNDRD